MSFKFKTIIFFLLISLIPYAITMVMFGTSFRDEQKNNVEKELKTQLNMTLSRINQNLQTLQNDLKFMAKSEVMSDIYTSDLDRRISRLLLNKKNDLDLIGDFYLTNSNNTIIASSDFSSISKNYKSEPTYYTDVISPFDGKIIARLNIHYDLKNLTKYFTNTPNRHYYVMDENNNILFRPKEFEDSILVKDNLDSIDGVKIVLIEDKSYAYRLLEKYQFWFIVTLIIGTLFICAMAIYFASNLIKPLKRLSSTAKDVTKTRNYDIQVPIDRSDEIGHLGESFNTMIKGIKGAMSEINELNEEIEATQREVVFTMGAIGESRSKETGNHVKRVAEYSKLLALYYGLSEDEAEMLKQASPMHDIGKVAIPDAILNKPGKFTDEEFEYMKKHAQLGFDMLKGSSRPLLKAAAIVAHEHHEKYNGKGYPRGLRADEIHIYGRITAVADVFDALGSDRCYKKAWDDEKIFDLFKKERGEHFDPKLVDIFFKHLDEFLAIRDRFKDIH
jgi:response regulator RpfG family c-di-GMP phosphodiesterase